MFEKLKYRFKKLLCITLKRTRKRSPLVYKIVPIAIIWQNMFHKYVLLWVELPLSIIFAYDFSI